MDFADALFSIYIGLIIQVVQGHVREGDCLTLFKPGGGGCIIYPHHKYMLPPAPLRVHNWVGMYDQKMDLILV